jgi:hypothetical protein
VGVTDTSPVDVAPTPGQYAVCAHAASQGAGESKRFPCKASARYVIVQLLDRNYLTLCEVVVSGGGFLCSLFLYMDLYHLVLYLYQCLKTSRYQFRCDTMEHLRYHRESTTISIYFLSIV